MNYNESQVVGSTWTRASQIIIGNPLNGRPSIAYVEEIVVSLGDKTITESKGVFNTSLDVYGSIALRDQTTGELTGQTLPVGVIYNAIYSDYMNKALERDALATPPEPPPTPTP